MAALAAAPPGFSLRNGWYGVELTGGTMCTYQDRLIEGSGSCPLAIRDYGGDGTPVLLLHGATRTLSDWQPVARELLCHHRVVAMDLRNHGRSGDGPWTWDAVLDDLQLTMAATGLQRPAIVGHSLGGMIAALYAASGRECRCAINLDGYGRGRADQYVGISPAQVDAYWRDTITAFRAKWPDEARPVGIKEVRAFRAAVDADAEAYGIPGHIAASGLKRSIKKLPNGRYLIRPSTGSFQELNYATLEIDWFATFRRARTPVLIYNCVAPDPMPAQSGAASQAMAAYRQGLRRDLASLADEAPHVSVRTLEANHMLIVNMVEIVSTQIHQYIESVAER